MDEEQLRALEEAPAPEDAEELKRLNRLARGALMETLDRFAAADLLVRRAGSWSAKDHIAHLVAWERMIVATARNRSAQRFAGLEPGADEGRELAEINELLFERSKESPWDDVLREFDTAYAETTALLDALSDDELGAPWEGASSPSVAQRIAGDAYQHYLEHRRWLNESLS